MSASGGGAAAATADAEVAPPRADLLRRFVQGDLAELRVVIALAVIWAIFYIQEERFLSSVNLTNLVLQATAVGLVAVGVVLVLLLGEIDLSVGAVSGLCAAVMAVLVEQKGWSPYLGIAAGVLAGTAIGLFQGSVFTRFAIPSFVVTLAGLLAWPGAQLKVLGETGTVNLTDPKITGLTNTFYSDTVGWIFALLILLGFVLLFFYITTRTTFGRHIFAVGGNAEAARRAGIKVNRVRVLVFMIASTMAAVGGIMAASRLLAVNQSSGSGEFLLLAIAAPVIAGTSLFGGRWSGWRWCSWPRWCSEQRRRSPAARATPGWGRRSRSGSRGRRAAWGPWRP